MPADSPVLRKKHRTTQKTVRTKEKTYVQVEINKLILGIIQKASGNPRSALTQCEFYTKSPPAKYAVQLSKTCAQLLVRARPNSALLNH